MTGRARKRGGKVIQKERKMPSKCRTGIDFELDTLDFDHLVAAMKRSQSSEEAPVVEVDGPAAKRAKTTPSSSQSPAAATPAAVTPSLSTPGDSQGQNAPAGDQQTWTKVEKRKKKKATKNEAKNDVCVFPIWTATGFDPGFDPLLPFYCFRGLALG
jgi:transcription elongation factor